MPEMYLREPRFTYSACGSFTKKTPKKQHKCSKKKDIHDIFIKTNYLVFSMTCLMEFLRI